MEIEAELAPNAIHLTIPRNAPALSGIPCKFPQKAHHYRQDIQILFVTLQGCFFPRNLLKGLRRGKRRQQKNNV